MAVGAEIMDDVSTLARLLPASITLTYLGALPYVLQILTVDCH